MINNNQKKQQCKYTYTRYWFILPVPIIIGQVTKLQKFTISTKIKKSRQVQSVSGSVYFRWYRELRPWSHTMFPSFCSNRFYSHSPSLWNPGHSQHLLQSFSNSLTIQDNHIQINQFLQVLFYTGVLYKWGMHPTWPQVNKKNTQDNLPSIYKGYLRSFRIVHISLFADLLLHAVKYF